MRVTALVCGGMILVNATLEAQTVTGRVIDAYSREPLNAVTLRLLQGDREIAATISDTLGRYTLEADVSGRYTIVTSRIGYGNLRTEVLDLERGQALGLELQMSSEAIRIAPITALVARNPYLETKGFYERMRGREGDFMTEETIRKRNASTLVDVLRTMRGVKIQRNGWRQEVYVAGGTCLPQIVVDGVTLRWGGRNAGTIQPLDDLVSVPHIQAIEVYRGGSGAPREFVGPNAGCGLILIWTRHS